MFFDRSGRILDRHVPATEVDHSTTRSAMPRIKRCLFQLQSRCGQACLRGCNSLKNLSSFSSVIVGFENLTCDVEVVKLVGFLKMCVCNSEVRRSLNSDTSTHRGP